MASNSNLSQSQLSQSQSILLPITNTNNNNNTNSNAAATIEADAIGPDSISTDPLQQQQQQQQQQFDFDYPPVPIVPTIQNVVSTVNLGCKLDLKSIAMRARNAEYNPKRFAAVILRLRQPKTTGLLFSSGKLVITGADSEYQSIIAARKYARIIQSIGYSTIRFIDFHIQNIVASSDCKFPIRLEGLSNYSLIEEYCNYEPELFPGLIYRLIKPKSVILIFVSGKIVISGCKSTLQVEQACRAIYPIILAFRKGNINPQIENSIILQQRIDNNNNNSSSSNNNDNQNSYSNIGV